MRAKRTGLGRGGAVVMLALAVAPMGWARSKPKPVDCRITVHITNDQHRPVANAGVVLDQVANLHRQKVSGALDVEIKSDAKGNATLLGFVPGVVLVQVIAPNYNTFGRYFLIKKQKTIIQVHLQPPGKQISAFH